MRTMTREPTHPSVFLEEDYLLPLGISITKAATLLEMDEATLMLFLHKKIRCTEELALKLESIFHVEREFWVSAQKKFDGWRGIN